jgi:recombination protein RecA
MSSAARIRQEIEATLAARIPAALSLRFRNPPELLSTGIAEIDALLHGGLPLGGLTEIAGPACSGRTTLVSSLLAGVTRQGEACAYVDVSDAFDPLSAAAMGMDLGRLLWVRAGRAEEVPIVARPSPSRATPRENKISPPQFGGYGGSRHPRTEIRGIAGAVQNLFRGENAGGPGGLLRDKRIGNPGAPNRPFAAPPAPHWNELFENRSAHFAGSPQLARRDENNLREENAEAPGPFRAAPRPPLPSENKTSGNQSWFRLDQALRATDLLLNAGGFRVIVLDMGDAAPGQVRRVPLASWYRYRLQAEKSQALFLLLTQTPSAHSCASVALHCQETREQAANEPSSNEPAAKEQWEYAAQNPDALPLLSGFQYCVSADRKRAAAREPVYAFGKKPVSASASSETSWKRTTLWAR